MSTGPSPQYDFLYSSNRLDIFAETVTNQLSTRTVIVQNIVALQFNKSGTKVTDRSGYQRTTVVTESGETVNYSQPYISPGLAAFVQTIEGLGRPQSVWDKYWDFILSPSSEPILNRFINSGYLNKN